MKQIKNGFPHRGGWLGSVKDSKDPSRMRREEWVGREGREGRRREEREWRE